MEKACILIDLNFGCFVPWKLSQTYKKEVDLVIKTQINNNRLNTNNIIGKHKERIWPRQQYYLKGIPISRKPFCFLHDVKNQKILAISEYVDTDGLKPRKHYACGKQPENSLLYRDRDRENI